MVMTAHKNEPIIPNVWVRKPVKESLPMLTAYVTAEVLTFPAGTVPQQMLYKTLKAKGFDNEEFTELFQLATDYFDYLKYDKQYSESAALREAARKSCEVYVAKYIKDNKLFSTLTPGTRNFYEGLANEYPELKERIEVHHRNYGVQEGEKHVYPQQQQFIPGQTYQDQNGQFFTVDAYGRMIYVQPPAQAMPPEVRHAASMMRRNNSQYAPAAPAYPAQAGWGANPVGYAPMGQPMAQPMAMAQPRSQYAPSSGGYTEYSQQAPDTGLMTAYSPTKTRQAPAQQMNVSVPEPQVTSSNNWADNSNSYANYHSQQQNVAQQTQQADPPAEVTTFVATAPVEDRKYVKTSNGYETDYYSVDVEEWPLNPLGYPVIYDADTVKAVFRLDKNKNIQDLIFITGGKAMDYDKHENVNLLKSQRRGSGGPDKEATIKMLAQIQREKFIEETLEAIMGETVEGNVTGDVEDKHLDKPIFINRLVLGNNEGHDYIYTLKDVLKDSPLFDKVGTNVFNYEYQYVIPMALAGEHATIAKKFRNAKDWLAIRRTLDEFGEANVEPTLWTYINQFLTKYVNDVVNYRLGVDVNIDSFDIDIEELVDMLQEQYGSIAEFNRAAKEVANTFLSVIEAGTNRFDSYFGEGNDGEVAFAVNTDVTVLPLTSDNLFIPVPVDEEEDENTKPTQAVVTKESFPELYHAIFNRMRNVSSDCVQVMFVTMDGIGIRIHRATSSAMYYLERV